MPVKPDPPGFPQRRCADVCSVTAAQMRDVQRLAQEEFGLDILQLTENAGRSAALLAFAMLGGRGRGQRVVVLAGGGNKGAAGVEEEVSFTARRQMHILRQSGLLQPADLEASEVTLEEHLASADLVIDALVGYGLEGPPVGVAAAVTRLAIESRRPILALDVPTGVNATTGEVSTPAIRAVTTLMLDLPKRGCLESQARGMVGELYLADIGIPLSVHQRLGIPVGQLYADGPIVRLRR